MMNNIKSLMLAGVVAVLLSSCSQTQKSSEPVVASAGSEKLHLGDLENFLPERASVEISKVQLQNYIQRWSEKELIYQYALSEKFNKDPEIKNQLREVQKDYLVALYLQQNIDNLVKVTEDEIKTYYEENKDEFIRAQDYYNIQLILVESSQEGYNLRRRINNGEEFADVARELSLDASAESGGKLGWVTLDELPEDLARRIPSLSVGSVSVPLRTSLGYYVVEVLDVRKEGDTQTLEEVHDVVSWRIKARKREEDYRQLVNQLKEEITLSIDWSVLDSLNLK